MDRRFTMARFEEPTESRPVCKCESCDRELFEGEDVVEVYDIRTVQSTFCSDECLLNHIGACRRTL
ncbi:hypothetical protein [Priestia megaterium]|uniref:hypothetical protein n=1 Tax=Priestia megaterium TaxID=1404 RepID=UPI000BEC6A20|nr:hypothetical protein [Priestia megaterium]PED63999.1 hypothetical protein CON20_23840 [Priestia megaterium]